MFSCAAIQLVSYAQPADLAAQYRKTPAAAQFKLHPGPGPISEYHSRHIWLFSFTFTVIYIHSLSGALNPQLKVKVSQSHAMLAQRGRRSIALLILNLGAGWRWVVNATPQPLYSREGCPAPTVQQAGWAPGPVWTSVKKRSLFCTGARTSDRPARRQSLYPLRYSGTSTPN